ncbi:MAG: cobalt-precorrin 5A hydrolase, partial [Fusobacteriaceae bacterium]
MRIAIWTVTRGAVVSALKIKEKNLTAKVYSLKKFDIEETIQMDNFTETLNNNFKNYDVHIFIMATGIVVRKIANLLKSKDVDPAV